MDVARSVLVFLLGAAAVACALFANAAFGEGKGGEAMAQNIRVSSLALVAPSGKEVAWLRCDDRGRPELVLAGDSGAARIRLGLDTLDPTEKNLGIREEFYAREWKRSGGVSPVLTFADSEGDARLTLGQDKQRYGLVARDAFSVERAFVGTNWVLGSPGLVYRSSRGRPVVELEVPLFESRLMLGTHDGTVTRVLTPSGDKPK